MEVDGAGVTRIDYPLLSGLGESVLFAACLGGHLETVEFLLQIDFIRQRYLSAFPHPHECFGVKGLLPLGVAILQGHHEVAALLRENGAVLVASGTNQNMWPSKAGLASAPQAAAKVADAEMAATDEGSTSTPAKAKPPPAEKKRKRATPMAERAAKAGVASELRDPAGLNGVERQKVQIANQQLVARAEKRMQAASGSARLQFGQPEEPETGTWEPPPIASWTERAVPSDDWFPKLDPE
jgi:hypothetical protein|eukprot:3561721-Prymnesium_polylepis.1